MHRVLAVLVAALVTSAAGGATWEAVPQNGTTDLSSPSAATPWGDPDIAGTYVRQSGPPPMICGAERNIIVIPPLYAGVTQIVQSRQQVAFRSQFVRQSRIVPLNGRDAAPTPSHRYLGQSRGYWEAGTLVIVSTGLHAQLLTALVERDARLSQDMQIVERFTPAENGTIDYEFVVNDPSIYNNPPIVIGFTLMALPARGAGVDSDADRCPRQDPP